MLICDRRRLCQVSDYRRNSFLLNLPQRTLAPACSITKNMLICLIASITSHDIELL